MIFLRNLRKNIRYFEVFLVIIFEVSIAPLRWRMCCCDNDHKKWVNEFAAKQYCNGLWRTTVVVGLHNNTSTSTVCQVKLKYSVL